METTSQNKKDLLKLFIIFSIGGSFFDQSLLISPLEWTNTVTGSHLFLKDLMYVGLACGWFMYVPYKDLKVKTFLFMVIIWRVFATIINLSGGYYPEYINIFYAIYLYWLFRIYIIKEIPHNYTANKPKKNAYSYNIFIPVHTFRGLLKALFVPLSDPRYETTILVSGDWMYYIKNQYFFKIKKDDKVIDRLINKTNANVKVKPVASRKMRNIERLSFKRAILGLRDCRRLQI